jgi:hypothetical protein
LFDGSHELKGQYQHTLAVIGVLFRLSEKSHPFIEKLRIEDFQEISEINF